MAIKGYSAEQLRAAEAPHLAAGEPLMRRAAAGLAAEIRRELPVSPTDRTHRLLLLVGSGNNGADALYAGAELSTDGVEVAIIATADRIHEEALRAARNAGARVVDTHVLDATAIAVFASRFDIIVDGILGTGTSAHPALRGNARALVSAILPALTSVGRPLVVAVDIPSGINPDDGTVPDSVVLPADLTVTFGGYKAGLLIPPASGVAGRVRLIDIGLGPDLDALEPLVVVGEDRSYD